MDADGLPLIGPGIDFSKVEAIHQKRTLAFLNHFITHTARFMNRFSCVCEEKLADLCIRMQRLETSMSILEAKLSSIPGLENVTVSTTPATQPQQSTTDIQSEQTAQPSVAAPQVTEKEPEPEPEPDEPKATVAQDPSYAKYFKMVNMGVPVVAVKQKMQMEGLNPDFLDTPNAAAPASSNNNKGGDDSDFSDEEEDSDASSDDFTDDD